MTPNLSENPEIGPLAGLVSLDEGDEASGIMPTLHATDLRAMRKVRYLATLEVTGNQIEACRRAGTSLAGLKRWMEADPQFKAACETALSVAGHRLEIEARRRAADGLRKYKFHKGYPVYWRPPPDHPDYELEDIPFGEEGYPGTRVKRVHYYELSYSDSLLAFLLKGAMPDKYGDRTEHTGEIVHKLYAGIDLDDIGSRSLKDIPPSRERDQGDAEHRSGDSLLRAGEMPSGGEPDMVPSDGETLDDRGTGEE